MQYFQLNICVSDFRELQSIYESSAGLSMDAGPNRAYPVAQSKHSYRGNVPFNAGGSDNLYARMELNHDSPMPIESEEENITGDIEKKRVIAKIDELMEKANSHEMMYAVHTLATLKDYIKIA